MVDSSAQALSAGTLTMQKNVAGMAFTKALLPGIAVTQDQPVSAPLTHQCRPGLQHDTGI